MLQVESLGLEAIRDLRPLVERIKTFDRDLANQIVRAASSIVLNIAEGSHSRAGTRRVRFESAQGSANETRSALLVAIAWGYVSEKDAAATAKKLDRIVGMLWGLTRG